VIKFCNNVLFSAKVLKTGYVRVT